MTSRQKHNDPKAVLTALETLSGVQVRRIWTTRFGRSNLLGRSFDYLTFYFSAFFCLLKNLKKGDAVVAETDPPLISVIAMTAAKLKGARLINWTQDIFPEVAVNLRVRIVLIFSALFRGARNLSLKSASMNIAIGEKMAALIKKQGVEDVRVCVIHNWSDGNQIRPEAREGSPLREEWGLKGKFVVGYSGNMGRAHEFNTILGAMEILSSGPDVVFLFIGDGKQRGFVENFCREKNITNVMFKPLQPYDRLGVTLGVADAHMVSLQPSLEGLIVPSKFYGILAAARPVLNIGDPEGELGNLIRLAGCGATVKPGDAPMLSQAVRDLAGDSQKTEEMGRLGRRYFEAHFDRPIALKAWYDVLQRAAE